MEDKSKKVIGIVFATMLLSTLLLLIPGVLGDSSKVVHQPIELVEYNQTGNESELVFIAPSESRSVQTPLARGEIEIKYDDGVTTESHGGFGWEAAVRFTPPSYPVYLKTARLYVGRLYFENYGEFAVLVYDDDGSNGEPGTLLGQVSNRIVTSSWPLIWYDVDLRGFGITITSGDFYIAFYPYDDTHQAKVGVDRTSPDSRSFKDGADSWNLVTDLDYMIRAIVDTDGGGVYEDNGVFRNGLWILPPNYRFNFGMSTDIPITGDWNGNGVDTIGVRRGRQWILSNSNAAPSVAYRVNYGLSTDIPVVGDWNGDGVDTVGVRRGRQWILSNSNTAPVVAYRFNYGLSTDIPVVGDWNGDGVDTVGVRRGRQWILSNSNTAPYVAYRVNYGSSTDIPVVGDWNGDGVDTIGVRRGRQWILSNSNTAPVVAYRFNYGLSTDIPVVGNWI